MDRKIIHVDMDAFYASVEQRDNPALQGLPVAVGHGAARGVVAAASYEARAFGVRSAMASVTAMRKCPQLVFVPPRFEVYKAVSAQIRDIFAEHTALIEPLSLDEAYLDVTENHQNIPVATEIANLIRARIKEVTGLNSSAGISYNKFLAKMASGHNKPNGYLVIPPAKGAAFVQALPIERFHGVGPATAMRMHGNGIFTGADLVLLTMEQLTARFGRSAQYYYDLARGIDHRQVHAHRERKSVGAEDTFAIDIDTLDAARAKLMPLLDKVWRVCGERNLSGRTVTLKVKFSDFEQITRSKSHTSSIEDWLQFSRTAGALLEQVFPSPMPVRLLGITLSGFTSRSKTTSQLAMEL